MRLIQYQRRLVRANAEAFANIEANLEEVRRTSAAVDQIRSSGTTPRLDEAITAALLIEDRAASYHLRTAIKQANPDVTRLLQRNL